MRVHGEKLNLHWWGLMRVRDALVEFYRRLATDLPADVEAALVGARQRETRASLARTVLGVILDNVRRAREMSYPICQDTGIPIFYVGLGRGWSMKRVRQAILVATQIATAKVPLRPNAVEVVSGNNSGDGTGFLIPLVHFEQHEGPELRIEGMLKGGGSENVSRTYSLPDARLRAGRDLDGVRRCVLEAVANAQGMGCPPMIIGVGIAGAKDAGAYLAKRQLLRLLDDSNSDPLLAKLERKVAKQANSLGIGPMGLGGRTGVLGVKVGAAHRHPASYFVDISFLCWAARRGRMTFYKGSADYQM